MPWRCAFDLVTTVSRRRGRVSASARPGEDRDVETDLLGQAAMDPPAGAGIFALGVLADDDPIEIRRLHRPQRPRDAGQKPGRADVGVLVEPLADGKAQAPEGDVVGKAGIAHRAEVDRVHPLQQVEAVFGHHPAVAAVVVGPPG
jgi:hypothetical protein